MKKKEIIIIIVPVLLIILVYFLFLRDNKKQEQTPELTNKDTSQTLFLPDMDTGYDKKDKSQLYDEALREKRNKHHDSIEMEEKSDDFFAQFEKMRDKDEKQKTSSSNGKKSTSYSSNNNHSYTSSKKQTTHKQTETNNTDQEQEHETSTKSLSKNNETENYYGLGIYGGGSVSTDNDQTNENNYIKATMEESMTIKDGSQVVFLLSEDCIIDGKKFEKMSIMYGAANFSSSPDIIINAIQDTRGNTYPVKLIGYNEKYQRGLYYDGEIKQAAEEARDNGVRQGAGVVGQTASAVGSTIQNVARTFQNIKIKVHEGYMMYFKEMN